MYTMICMGVCAFCSEVESLGMTFTNKWPLSHINMGFILLFKTLRHLLIELERRRDQHMNRDMIFLIQS